MENAVVKAKYVFKEDYEPEYITGAFGNVLPSGELVVNFYLERMPIPYETSQGINENGSIISELTVTDPNPEDFRFRRTIKSGVIMNQVTASNVFRWLKGKLIEMGVNIDEL